MAEAPCPSNLAPVVTTDYKEKGHYEEIAGLKTYVVGPANATKAIINVYDVFGYASQTIQGSDRLAESLNALVLIPDFLEGFYAQGAWFKDPTPEQKEEYARFGKAADFTLHVPKLLKVAEAGKEKYPNVTSWGAYGLCWGGKVAVLASQKDTPFKVSGQVHPGRAAGEDAEALTIPHIVLAAPEDNKAGGIDGYIETFKKDGRIGEVETYETMFHGWMGARANLKDEANAKEYERGYNQLASFLLKYL